MYTHRIYRERNSFMAGSIELYDNGKVIGYLTVYDKKMFKNPYSFILVYNSDIYRFETLADVFTALRMLKDIC